MPAMAASSDTILFTIKPSAMAFSLIPVESISTPVPVSSNKENVKLKIKYDKGITLIALVITVIVLLILAGVTIAALSGDNWILTKVKEAKEKTEQAQQNEEQTLSNMENMLGIYKFKNINKADTNPAVFSDLTKDTT